MSARSKADSSMLPRTVSGKQACGLALLAGLGIVEVSRASKIPKERLENFFFRNDALSAEELTTVVKVLRRAIHRRLTAATMALMNEPIEAEVMRSPTSSALTAENLEHCGFTAF